MSRAIRWPHPGVRAWYSINAIVTVFAEMTNPFVPLLITALAHGSGLQGPDYDQPCQTASSDEAAALLCRVRVFNHWVAPGSIFLWLRSAAAIINVVVLTPLGPLADQRKNRYKMLVTSVVLIFLTTALILPLPSRATTVTLWISTILVVLQFSCFGLYQTISSALLREVAQADVARAHGKTIMVSAPSSPAPRSPTSPGSPRSLHSADLPGPAHATVDSHAWSVADEESRFLTHASESTPLLLGVPRTSMPIASVAELGLAISRLASRSDAIGSFLSLSVLLGGAGLLRKVRADDIPSMQLAIGVPSVVFLPIGLVVVRGLRAVARHGAGGQGSANPGEPEGEKESLKWYSGWSKIWHMVRLRNLRELSTLYGFMGLLVIIWDAFGIQGDVLTIIFITRLSATPSDLMVTSAIALTANTLWTFIAPSIQRRTGISNKSMLLLALAVSTVPCVWGMSGMVTGGRLGYHRKLDYALAIIPLQLGYSSVANYSRALLAEMIPEGHESSFFTLSAFFRRGASFLGPLIVGAVANKTGTFDAAFVICGATLAVCFVCAAAVDVQKGIAQGRAWTGP